MPVCVVGADVTLHFIVPSGLLMIDFFKCSGSCNTQKQGAPLLSRDVIWQLTPSVFTLPQTSPLFTVRQAPGFQITRHL